MTIKRLEGEQTEQDPNLLPIILDHINPGDTVIDCGAWIGGHTMAYLGKVGIHGCVFAFEPNFFAYECLTANAPQAFTCNVALGDKNQLVHFTTNEGWYDSGHVGGIAPVVQMRRLDDYQLAPNFIKIDVEGCEYKVLVGAARTIIKHRPKMVIEINPEALKRQGSSPHHIFDWIQDNGYSWQTIGLIDEIYNIITT